MRRENAKPEQGEVSAGQSDFQRWRVRKVPRSIGATRRFRGVLPSDTALAEPSSSCGAWFPLLPEHRPNSLSEPVFQLAEHFRGFTWPEIASIRGDIPNITFSRDSPDSLLPAG